GKDADLAAFPLDDLAAVPHFHPVDAAVFSLGGRAATLVTVAGRALVERGSVRVGDAGLAARVSRIAGRLAEWRRGEGAGRLPRAPAADR
ncbi:MAG TPA: hypothetical protein VFS05_15015, partial [Gemmatimonadaceae bacterium]|nr:hypothetical protein [Gemmatimonadaceae bacterium]